MDFCFHAISGHLIFNHVHGSSATVKNVPGGKMVDGLPLACNFGLRRKISIVILFFHWRLWRGAIILNTIIFRGSLCNINWFCISFISFGGHSVENLRRKFRNHVNIWRGHNEI